MTFDFIMVRCTNPRRFIFHGEEFDVPNHRGRLHLLCGLSWGEILMSHNLNERNHVDDWCCMCGQSGETMDHLLLHCGFACVMWSYVFRLYGVHLVMSHRVVDLLNGWHNWFGK